MRIWPGNRRGVLEPCTVGFVLITCWWFSVIDLPDWQDFVTRPTLYRAAVEAPRQRIRPPAGIQLPPRYRFTAPRFSDPVGQLVGPRADGDPLPNPLSPEAGPRYRPPVGGRDSAPLPGVPVGDSTPAREVQTIRVRPAGLRMLLP